MTDMIEFINKNITGSNYQIKESSIHSYKNQCFAIAQDTTDFTKYLFILTNEKRTILIP
ncbi:MAG: hypothetical protein ACK5G7_03295 [Erysipelotrichaceae bacterium]